MCIKQYINQNSLCSSMEFCCTAEAMSLLGLGSENLIQVETDDAFRVNVAEMRRVAKNLEKNFKVIESRWDTSLDG